ncbi:MAG TPA: hypothetical protein VJB59_00370 [Bdellovibrionota bacterium]|nr:hypothetical protein [Bdellovibrionota bacterium]
MKSRLLLILSILSISFCAHADIPQKNCIALQLRNVGAEAELGAKRRELLQQFIDFVKTHEPGKKQALARALMLKAQEILTREGTVWMPTDDPLVILISPLESGGSQLNRFAHGLRKRNHRVSLKLNLSELEDGGAAFERRPGVTQETEIWLPVHILTDPKDGIPIAAHEALHARIWANILDKKDWFPSGRLNLQLEGDRASVDLEELLTEPYELRLYAMKEMTQNATDGWVPKTRIPRLMEYIRDRSAITKHVLANWVKTLEPLSNKFDFQGWTIVRRNQLIGGRSTPVTGLQSPSGKQMISFHSGPPPFQAAKASSRDSVIYVNLATESSSVELWMADADIFERAMAWLQKASASGHSTMDEATFLEFSTALLRPVEQRLMKLHAIANANLEFTGKMTRALSQNDSGKIAVFSREMLKQIYSVLGK